MTRLFLNTSILEVFGLEWQSMLFYLGNFTILVGLLVWLLYKPVKKLIKDKRDSLDAVYRENERLKDESARLKDEYEKSKEELRLENARTAARATAAAQEKADAIIADAHEQAKSIIEIAKRETVTQSEQLKGEYRDSVNTLAVQVAQKLLEREISNNDNAELIEQVLSDWEND